MRAITVNEDQNFERGKSPKSAMNIGGINLKEEMDERLDELAMQMSHTAFQNDESWQEYLRKILVSKTITAKMTKMPTINKKGTMSGTQEKGEFTIEVQYVKVLTELSELYHQEKFTTKLLIADMDNNIYNLDIAEKIYIES